MINFIGGRYRVTLDFGSSDEEMRVVLSRLNRGNSYMQHVLKLRTNVARSVKPDYFWKGETTRPILSTDGLWYD